MFAPTVPTLDDLGRPKVSDLNVHTLIQEYVLWLEVSVGRDGERWVEPDHWLGLLGGVNQTIGWGNLVG